MGRKGDGLVEKTHAYILELIMSGQLMPGDRIPEQKIAQEFGTSRSPVRDAMRQLANEGLITIYPNRFAEVNSFDEKAVTEMGALRVSLDLLSTKLALLLGSQADFLRLQEIAKQCLQAFEAGDFPTRIKLDCDFHMELSRISGNTILEKFQRELYLRVQFIILHRPNIINDSNEHLIQHFDLIDALMHHDEDKATGIVKQHLSSFYNLDRSLPKDFFR